LVCLAIAVIVGVICYVALVFILRVPEAGVVATTVRSVSRRILARTRAYSDVRKEA
jgi:hypothetical protein